MSCPGMKKRWKYIDLLRACSMLLIILYHYEVDLEINNLVSLGEFGIRYTNIHMAQVGVALFFMVSGFGLMYSSYDEFSVKTFLKKRCLRIYLPFYAVSLLTYLSRKILISGAVFEDGIPAWHIIFTILGVDGYLKEYGIPTFSLGIGEWFLGCLILMYFCFPFLRAGFKKNTNVMMLLSTICYVVTVAFYHGSVPPYYFFFIKIYDFILGMFFAMVLKRQSRKSLIIMIPATLFLILCPYIIPLDRSYIVTIVCALIFLSAFELEGIKTTEIISGSFPVKILAKYSYEMFLIHHWGLIFMNKILRPSSVASAVICFILELGIICICGIILKRTLENLEKLLIKRFQKGIAG